jgi:hypothetical protein
MLDLAKIELIAQPILLKNSLLQNLQFLTKVTHFFSPTVGWRCAIRWLDQY